jgi:hypothetical protein
LLTSTKEKGQQKREHLIFKTLSTEDILTCTYIISHNREIVKK